MANIKSQKKRILTNEKARLRNNAVKSELKTAIRAVTTAVESATRMLLELHLLLPAASWTRLSARALFTRTTLQTASRRSPRRSTHSKVFQFD